MTELTGVSAALPLALLPVRLETRYVTTGSGGTELLVRIFPDTIHQDAHDPRLAPVEVQARERYAAEGGYGPDGEAAAAAWRRLADQFGAARAAWIARTGDPGYPTRANAQRCGTGPPWPVACPTGGSCTPFAATATR
ncbi:hypothetical protein ACFQ1L_29765 [Phytohabitans flavus]|uniref:hypothetical protein n=1 Tax=Phytohabitans flavus TaxID=1076124 RepID=UPI00363A7145